MNIPPLKGLTADQSLDILCEWRTGNKMWAANLYKQLTGDTRTAIDIYKYIDSYISKYFS